MNKEYTLATTIEMDKRTTQAQDFYNRILDLEEHPMFCSDKACFWDLYVGDPEEGRELIYREFDVLLTDKELLMPFWQLLDLLYKNKND